MIFDPWYFFFIIITNLIAAVIIFLFLKVKHKKQNINIKNNFSHNKNVKTLGLPNAPTSCPFMAAFTHAKHMEDLKKKTDIKIPNHVALANVVNSAKNEAMTVKDLKCKNDEKCELKTKSSYIKESPKKVIEQNKVSVISDEIINSKYSNNSSETTTNNITSNLKKGTLLFLIVIIYICT